MGANSFEDDIWVDTFPNFDASESKKKREEIIGNAFNALSKQAEEYHGHQEGYSGEINSKDGWTYLGSMTRKKFDEYKKVSDIYAYGSQIGDDIERKKNELKTIDRSLRKSKKITDPNLKEIANISYINSLVADKARLQSSIKKLEKDKATFESIKSDPIVKKMASCDDDKWGPACVVLISDEKREINAKKTTGFKFSPINKSSRPFAVYNCDKYNTPNTFADLNSAKAMIKNNVGKSYCMNPTITKIYGTIKVDPMVKEVKQKQTRLIFFGMAPS